MYFGPNLPVDQKHVKQLGLFLTGRPRNFLTFLACLRQSDGDGLFAAAYRLSTPPTLEFPFFILLHDAFDFAAGRRTIFSWHIIKDVGKIQL